MKRILFPIEDQIRIDDAFALAAQIAKRNDGKLILLYSYQSEFSNSKNIKSKAELIKAAHLRIQQAKDNYLKRYVGSAEAQLPVIDYRFIENRLWKGVSEILTTEHIDMALFTLSEMRSNNERHIRSFVARMFEKSNVPVLIIPETSYFAAVNQILLVSGFENMAFGESLFRQAAFLAHIFDAHLYVFYVGKQREDAQLPGNIQKMAEKYDIIKHGFTLHAASKTMLVPEIQSYIRQKDIDLMLMVKQEKSLFERILKENFTQQILIQTEIPIIIFNDKITSTWG